MNTTSPQAVRTVVVATDLSPASEIAVDQAAMLARRWDADLVLLHVFNDGVWATITAIYESEVWAGAEPVLVARNRLSQQVREVAARHAVRARGETRTGRAASEIAAFCREQDAQLLVVGEHGEAVLGGTAQRVLARADLPVLLVRRAVSAELSCILLATDFSDNATRAAQLSLDWFPDVRQRLLNACTVAFEGRMRMAGVSLEHIEGYRRDELARAEQRMEAQMQALRSAAPVGKRIVQGYPTTVLLREIERSGAELLVIGKHGGTMLDERLLGSITQNLLYRADCNVLLVP
jgi:nucleotide-binding universal stress UspA family protein